MTSQTQKIYTQENKITYTPGSNVSLPLLYTTGDSEKNLTGLTLNVHYDSSSLTPYGSNNGVSNQISAAIKTIALVDDNSNLDNDSKTDKIIRLAWGSFDSSFPGITLPAAAATLTFTTSNTTKDPITGASYSTDINYTASSTASNYSFETSSTNCGSGDNINSSTVPLSDSDHEGAVSLLGLEDPLVPFPLLCMRAM